jgi:ubiquinone/menaquinone biosynthesis C-methylase UbiE
MTQSPSPDPVRVAYDTVANEYAEHYRDELSCKPIDRAMVAAFADLVRGVGDGTVADLGCGPGHVTAHLQSLGLRAFGVDMSPEMVALARSSYPEVAYEVGSMAALSAADGSLSGVVASYSIVHTPTPDLPAVFAEFHRVLAPGGFALLAFQVGDEARDVKEMFGHPVSIRAYLRTPERVADLLSRAGLTTRAQLVRAPLSGIEDQPQAFLLSCKAGDPVQRV